MSSRDMEVLAEAGRLVAAGEPFALATVVSVRRPASARRGDRAIVTADGALVGWVGGACSEPVVVREALRAVAEGTPRLVRIGPEGTAAGPGEDVVCGTRTPTERTTSYFVDLDRIDRLVRSSKALTIVYPLTSGYLEVMRFSLQGAAPAIDTMRAAVEQRAGPLPRRSRGQ